MPGRARIVAAPPCAAWTGESRAARRAGSAAPNRVATIPATAATAIEVPETARSPTGTSSPRSMTMSPSAIPSPSSRPAAVPATARTSASTSTLRATSARLAPSVRSIPSSRVRCSTVIVKLLRIRNPPTKSAIPPKSRRTTSSAWSCSATSSDTWDGVCTSAPAPSSRRSCAWTSSTRSRSRTWTLIVIHPSGWSKRLRASVSGTPARPAPPKDRPLENVKMPTTRSWARPAGARTGIVSPSVNPRSRAQPRSTMTSRPSRAGRPAV